MIRPNVNKVAIEQTEAAKQSPGGIVLPDNVRQKPHDGRVVAIGTWMNMKTMEVMDETVFTIGDLVVYPAFAGAIADLGEEEYLIISREDILAIIDEEQRDEPQEEAAEKS